VRRPGVSAGEWMRASETDTPRFDLRLAALLIGVVISTVDSSALNLALPSLATHFGTDAAAVQGAASLYLVGAALSFLPISGIAGRIGTVRVYRASLAAFAVISQFLALSTSLPMLLALRFVQGIAGAGIVGLVPGMTAATFREHRGWALGMVSGSVAAGTLLGPPLGGFLVEWFGWRSIFFINLPFGILALFLSGRLTDLHGVGLREGLRRALKASRFLLALSSTVCFFIQSFGVNLVWPFFLEAGGMSPARVGLMMLVPPLILMVIGPVCGQLSDEKGYDRVARECGAGTGILGPGGERFGGGGACGNRTRPGPLPGSQQRRRPFPCPRGDRNGGIGTALHRPGFRAGHGELPRRHALGSAGALGDPPRLPGHERGVREHRGRCRTADHGEGEDEEVRLTASQRGRQSGEVVAGGCRASTTLRYH